MNCKKCSSNISEGRIMCNVCGEMQENPNFSNEKLKSEFMKKMQPIVETFKKSEISSEYMWDKTVARYARVIERTKNILSSEIMADKVTDKMFKDMDKMLDLCRTAEFHVALVGAIKAGKSTLINAILGTELASTNVTPETAALTKFRSSKDDNYVKVSFYSSLEWNRLWKSAIDSKADIFLEEYNELKADSQRSNWIDKPEQKFVCETEEKLRQEIQRWTSSKSLVHYFVKEVEVGLKDFNMPPEVIFVDTPGLDDVVQYRSDITREYIRRANAVLVCVKSDALTGQEMGTIYSVFSNSRFHPEKIYIIGTQLDTLNRPQEGWVKQCAEWLKYFRRPDCYGDERLAKKNLIPVSGYLYTLLKTFGNISKMDDKYFDMQSILAKFRINIENLGENYQKMIDFTNIDFLMSTLNNDVVKNHKELLIKDIKENYSICVKEITELLQGIKKNQQELIETSEKGADEIHKKRDEYAREVANTTSDKKELESLIKLIKTQTNDRLTELTSTIKRIGE